MERDRSLLPRVERQAEIELEDSSEHGWAVSYADMLMVLLSFFVIFFSVEERRRSEIITIISDAIVQKGSSQAERELSSQPGVAPKDLASALAAPGRTIAIKEVNSSSTLIIELPSDIFAVGSFQISDRVAKELNEITQVIHPYREKIEIRIIGHADASPLRGQKSRAVASNFELSSLRAGKAVSYFMSQGFSGSRLSTVGQSDNIRASRSLTLQISSYQIETHEKSHESR